MELANLPLPGMPEPAENVPDLSQMSDGAKLTLRQAKNVKAGVHPLTGGILHPDADRGAYSKQPPSLTRAPFHCGSCRFRVLLVHRGDTYPKCEVWGPTRSAASDIRAWWPACPKWEPIKEEKNR